MASTDNTTHEQCTNCRWLLSHTQQRASNLMVHKTCSGSRKQRMQVAYCEYILEKIPYCFTVSYGEPWQWFQTKKNTSVCTMYTSEWVLS